MLGQEFEGSFIHDQTENLGADIHEHDTLPFVGIGEVAALGDGGTLAVVPFFVVGIADKEIVDVVVNVKLVSSVHCFKCFGGGCT